MSKRVHAKVFCAANHKGGVGKTTLVITLAEALVKLIKNAKVLVVDMDGQGNTSRVLAQDDAPPEISIHDVLLDRDDRAIFDAIKPSRIERVDHLPSRLKINNIGYAEQLRALSPAPFKVLKRRLATVVDQYDYILIDTRPALDILTLNALAASDGYMIPFLSGDIYALDGMDDLSAIVDTMILDHEVNPSLVFMGAVLQSHSANQNACKITQELIEERYGKILGVIPMSTQVRQAAMDQRTILSFAPSSPAAKAYEDLAQTIVKEF